MKWLKALNVGLTLVDSFESAAKDGVITLSEILSIIDTISKTLGLSLEIDLDRHTLTSSEKAVALRPPIRSVKPK